MPGHYEPDSPSGLASVRSHGTSRAPFKRDADLTLGLHKLEAAQNRGTSLWDRHPSAPIAASGCARSHR